MKLQRKRDSEAVAEVLEHGLQKEVCGVVNKVTEGIVRLGVGNALKVLDSSVGVGGDDIALEDTDADEAAVLRHEGILSKNLSFS